MSRCFILYADDIASWYAMMRYALRYADSQRYSAAMLLLLMPPG
jgi:hypothetical protein